VAAAHRPAPPGGDGRRAREHGGERHRAGGGRTRAVGESGGETPARAVRGEYHPRNDGTDAARLLGEGTGAGGVDDRAGESDTRVPGVREVRVRRTPEQGGGGERAEFEQHTVPRGAASRR